MSRNYSPTRLGWAVIVLSVAALTLGGCGRKGMLDLPPNSPPPPAAAAEVDTDAQQASRPSVFNPTYGAEAGPAATKGRKKAFVLDPLLND
ncbi:MAG TPA: lipoprotein [Bradyrhizobium sp.]|nr:lipoprotein [Bradyrhizobium sp.]